MAKNPRRLLTGKAIYEEIVDYLVGEITSGRLPEGSPVPSEGDLAKKFSVSRGTTKLALTKLADMGVVKRIARMGTFVESAPTQAISLKKEKPRVALMIPCLPDSYLRSIVEGVERVARANGVDIILRITDHDEVVESGILSEVGCQDDISGLIIYPVNGHKCCDELLYLKLKGLPIVVVDREYRGISVDSVVPDHFGGAKTAVRHLVELGHRRIGFASVDVNGCSASEMRYWGYVEAMAEAGLTVNPALVMKDGQLSLDLPVITPELIQTLQFYISRNSEITALFCANDYIAVAAIEAAANLGLSVPDRLSIIGFSNNEINGRSPVSVTTIEHGQAITGERAMELILRRISEPSVPFSRVCLEATLLRGCSTDLADRSQAS